MRERLTEYNRMYAAFQAGEISETEWRSYCDIILRELLEENAEVFKRLKNCS